MAAVEWITSVGAIPTVCVFRPLQGTDYANMPPPKTEDVVPLFRMLYEACMDRGLPIGCAPNVHVSLVMLPEEARALSSRRFRWKELRRRALKQVVSLALRRRWRALDSLSPERRLPGNV